MGRKSCLRGTIGVYIVYWYRQSIWIGLHGRPEEKESELSGIMAFAGKVALERKTVAEAAAQELRSRILSGVLPGGSQLRQEVLAAELGVSRIPLREAFRLLVGEGLVTIVPHRGAVVSVLSPEEIGELFDLRALIEPELIRHAIPNMTEEDLRNAEDTLAGYKSAFEQRDVESWGSLNTR